MGKRGQANLVQYVLMILFSVLVLASVSTLFYTFYINSLKNEIRETLTQLAVQTSDAIIKTYEDVKGTRYSPSNYSTVMIKEIEMKYPEMVSNRNYEISLATANLIWVPVKTFKVHGKNVTTVQKTSGAKIVAKTTQDPKITVEYEIPNIDVDVMGTSKNGLDSNIRYYRYNINGTVYDVIVLGESGILTKITGVS